MNQNTAPKKQQPETTPAEDRLRQVTRNILADARRRPAAYSEETIVPEGGE